MQGRAPDDQAPQAGQLRPVQRPPVPEGQDVEFQGAHSGRVAALEERLETALAHPPDCEVRRLHSVTTSQDKSSRLNLGFLAPGEVCPVAWLRMLRLQSQPSCSVPYTCNERPHGDTGRGLDAFA